MRTYIKVTEWKAMLGRPEEVCQAITCVIIETAAGRLIKQWRLMNSVLTRKELIEEYSLYTLMYLREAKSKELPNRLLSNIEDLIGTRTGLKGHRGYFKVKNIFLLQEKGGENE